MKYLLEKLKLFSVGLMALSFLMAVTLSSCGSTSQESEGGDPTEEHAEDADEAATDDAKEDKDGDHPEGEHPEGDEKDSDHPEGEHPTDSDEDEEEEEE